MANSTDPFAESVHGTNPQYLIEKITRLKIYNTVFWKEQCFGLTSETIIDKAVALKHCGGTCGGNLKPTDFLSLTLKMLQLQPEKEIILTFIQNDDFKYLRLLGALYLRLVGKPIEIYRYLEPLYADYRKIAYRGSSGWSLRHVDEFIDDLLNEELVCDIALPHLPKRTKLEELGLLQPRTSALDLDIEAHLKTEKEAKDQESGNDSEEEQDQDQDHEKEQQLESQNGNRDLGGEGEELHAASHTLNTKQSQVLSYDKESSAGLVRRDLEPPSSGPRRGEREIADGRDEDRDRTRDRSDDRERERERERDRDRRDSRDKDRDRDRDRGRRRSRSRDRNSKRDSRDRDRDRDRDRNRDRDYNRGRRDSRGRDEDRDGSRDRNFDRSRRDSRERDRGRSRDRDRDRDRDREQRGDYDDRKNYPPRSRDERADADEALHTDEPLESVEELARKKQKADQAASKKFDKLFKKSTSAANASASTVSASVGKTGPGEKVEEFSVEYWNQRREALGMSKLRTK